MKSKVKSQKSKPKKFVTNRKGFTLVELAIVLVIIGLLIGAVLKGQQMIDNARLKRVYNQQREIVAAVYSYYDKYGKLPGDDNTAAGRWGTPAPTGGTVGDGTIAGLVSFTCVAGATSETCLAWRHMRNANFITGSAASAVNPTHAYGAAIGVGYDSIQGLATNWIGFNNIPYDACQAIDLQYDDGSYLTGSIRGSTNYDTATTGVYGIYFRL